MSRRNRPDEKARRREERKAAGRWASTVSHAVCRGCDRRTALLDVSQPGLFPGSTRPRLCGRCTARLVHAIKGLRWR